MKGILKITLSVALLSTTGLADVSIAQTLAGGSEAIASSVDKRRPARNIINFGKPIINASDQGSALLVHELLQRGDTDVNVRGRFDSTALMRAAYRGYSAIGSLLVNAGADVNATDFGGATALHLSSREGHIDFVRLLVEKGADVNAADNEGWTPLMRAVANSRNQVAKELLIHDVTLNQTNSFGDTALILAARKGNEEVVSALLDRNADTRIQNSKGDTALSVSQQRGEQQIASLLEQHTIKPVAVIQQAPAVASSKDTAVVPVETVQQDAPKEPKKVAVAAPAKKSIPAPSAPAREAKSDIVMDELSTLEPSAGQPVPSVDTTAQIAAAKDVETPPEDWWKERIKRLSNASSKDNLDVDQLEAEMEEIIVEVRDVKPSATANNAPAVVHQSRSEVAKRQSSEFLTELEKIKVAAAEAEARLESSKIKAAQFEAAEALKVVKVALEKVKAAERKAEQEEGTAAEIADSLKQLQLDITQQKAAREAARRIEEARAEQKAAQEDAELIAHITQARLATSTAEEESKIAHAAVKAAEAHAAEEAAAAKLALEELKRAKIYASQARAQQQAIEQMASAEQEAQNALTEVQRDKKTVDEKKIGIYQDSNIEGLLSITELQQQETVEQARLAAAKARVTSASTRVQDVTNRAKAAIERVRQAKLALKAAEREVDVSRQRLRITIAKAEELKVEREAGVKIRAAKFKAQEAEADRIAASQIKAAQDEAEAAAENAQVAIANVKKAKIRAVEAAELAKESIRQVKVAKVRAAQAMANRTIADEVYSVETETRAASDALDEAEKEQIMGFFSDLQEIRRAESDVSAVPELPAGETDPLPWSPQ